MYVKSTHYRIDKLKWIATAIQTIGGQCYSGGKRPVDPITTEAVWSMCNIVKKRAVQLTDTIAVTDRICARLYQLDTRTGAWGAPMVLQSDTVSGYRYTRGKHRPLEKRSRARMYTIKSCAEKVGLGMKCRVEWPRLPQVWKLNI